MTTPRVNEVEILKAWAAFFILSSLTGLVIGAVIGAILGIALAAAEWPIESIKALCGVAGFFVGLPISYLFFRWSVGRFVVERIELSQAAFPAA